MYAPARWTRWTACCASRMTAASGCMSMAPTAASACSMSGCVRCTATWVASTRWRWTRTNGWGGRGAGIVGEGGVEQRSLVIGRPDFPHCDPATRADVGSPFDEFGEGSLYSSVDFSARSRSLTVWAALKEIGMDGMRARVRRHLDCARRVAELVRMNDRLELVAEPELSICCFRYIPAGSSREPSTVLDKFNEAVLKGI